MSAHLNLHYRRNRRHHDSDWNAEIVAMVSQRQSVVTSASCYHTFLLLLLQTRDYRVKRRNDTQTNRYYRKFLSLYLKVYFIRCHKSVTKSQKKLVILYMCEYLTANERRLHTCLSICSVYLAPRSLKLYKTAFIFQRNISRNKQQRL